MNQNTPNADGERSGVRQRGCVDHNYRTHLERSTRRVFIKLDLQIGGIARRIEMTWVAASAAETLKRQVGGADAVYFDQRPRQSAQPFAWCSAASLSGMAPE